MVVKRVVQQLWSTILALGMVGVAWGRPPGAQTASRAAVRPLGIVKAIDAAKGQIILKTDAGPELTVSVQEATAFLRVPPGSTDLKSAIKVALADLAVGDRILARGRLSDDQQSLVASSVIVMTKADIAKKQEADRAEWRRRGVGGFISAINAAAREVTISVPALAGPKPLTIALGNASLRRYAPDSVKFSDAKPGTFPELQVGDQVLALGNKSPDGARLTAEQFVSGSFRNIAATVTSVDLQEKTIKVTDLSTKKPLRVVISADSNLRKLPPFVAQMLALRRAGTLPGGSAGNGGAGRDAGGGRGEATAQARLPYAGGGSPPSGARRAQEGPPAGSSAGTPPGAAPGGPGGFNRSREGAPDMQQMLDRLPVVTLADLKPGDAIILASTVGRDPGQVTAITLLAGVEPLLSAAPGGGREMSLGSWNLDLNMNMSMP